MHIVVFILGKTAAKNIAIEGRGSLSIGLVDGHIGVVINRIVRRFIPRPGDWSFLRQHRAVGIVGLGAEVLVLDHPGPWHISIAVINHGIALNISLLVPGVLKLQGPIFEFSLAVAEQFIDLTRVNDLSPPGTPNIRGIRGNQHQPAHQCPPGVD